MTSLRRRDFLQRSAALGAGAAWLASGRASARPQRRAPSPGEKLNLGVVGVAHRGADNLDGVRSENIVALCDVDETYLHKAGEAFPAATLYTDYRKLLDRDDLDALVVSTPDHTHAVITMAALKAGLHVYCEKPLARTVAECRAVTDAARKRKRVTQLGTQIHAGSNYRRVVERVKSGVLGPLREVHVWLEGTKVAGPRPPALAPPPPTLHYDEWLGPVEYRPYSPEYLPASWRGWWAFGNGMLGDFGCHYMDLPFWALDLRYPTRVTAEGPPVDPESAPEWLIVRYEFPARGAQPPVTLTWYHGGKVPAYVTERNLRAAWPNGVLFVGEKGELIANYDAHRLLPETAFEGVPAPAPTLPDSVGHHREWIEACKSGGRATCDFEYSGPLSEAVLLGNVAYRAGVPLEWDAERLHARNTAAAEPFLRSRYRKGWRL